MKIPWGLVGSGYTEAGIVDISGGGGKKVSAMALALSVLSYAMEAVPLGDMVDSEGILVLE